MTKPHEETWYWDDDLKVIATGVRDPDADDDGWRIIVETDSGHYPPRDGARQLIAQAPAMARLLDEWLREGDMNPKTVRATLRAAGVLP